MVIINHTDSQAPDSHRLTTHSRTKCLLFYFPFHWSKPPTFFLHGRVFYTRWCKGTCCPPPACLSPSPLSVMPAKSTTVWHPSDSWPTPAKQSKRAPPFDMLLQQSRLLSAVNTSVSSSSSSSSSSDNWILMSCQPHRVTSGQSNSGHKQIHTSKLFSLIYQPSVKSIYKANYFTNIKHIYSTNPK